MTNVTITADFKIASYPFWEADNVTSSEPLLDRGTRASMVAVRHFGRNDYRLKIWLDNDLHFSDFIVNGIPVTLTSDHTGLHTANINARDLSRILNGPPSNNGLDEDYIPDPYLDACVETTFNTSNHNRYGMALGDTSNFPAWMEARSIAITQPQTAGGSHYILLDAPGINPDSKNYPPAIRVNGIWCLCSPIVDTWDSNNYGSWGGRHQLVCDPLELNIIRAFNDEDALPEELENSPIPPRSRQAVRDLHLLVNLSRQEYYEWTKDVHTIFRTVQAMTGLQGQIDVLTNKRSMYKAKLKFYTNRLTHFYDMRGELAQELSLEQWIQQSQDRNILELRDKRDTIYKAKTNTAAKITDYTESVDNARVEYEAALTNCEKREERFAAAIVELYPDTR